jgi:hypothetical protein
MEWELLDQALDVEVERFPTIINSPAGRYVRNRSPQDDPDEVGDLGRLEADTRDLLDSLPGKQHLSDDLNWIGKKPYALEFIAAHYLLEACAVARSFDLPLSFQWRFPLKDTDVSFGYRDAFFWGLDQIKTTQAKGSTVEIEFVGRYRYRIPVDFARSWNLERLVTDEVVVDSCEIDTWGHSALVHLKNGEQLDLTSVSILAGCETTYEHFGGWSAEAEQNVRAGFDRYGLLRIFPVEK